MAVKVVVLGIPIARNESKNPSRYRLRPPHGFAASRVRGPVSFGTGNR